MVDAGLITFVYSKKEKLGPRLKKKKAKKPTFKPLEFQADRLISGWEWIYVSFSSSPHICLFFLFFVVCLFCDMLCGMLCGLFHLECFQPSLSTSSVIIE
jgi:hypothetical protein